MVFSDLLFLFVFLPAFALCYLLAAWIDRRKGKEGTVSFGWRNSLLVLFSLVFYAWGEPVYVLLLLASVVVNYFVGRGIDRPGARQRKTALVLGLVFNLGVLATFKYANFFVDNIYAVIGRIGNSPLFTFHSSLPRIALPIGISFYTFQSISYLIDVYRRTTPVQRNFRNLLLYISMFPQLIAGPIVRYGTVAGEITDRHVDAHDLSEGMMRFLRGLGKKVILANQLSEISTQLLTGAGLESLTTAGAWVGILAFTFQIYYDFSGYSDMAIGIGRCLGFHFNENFNHPYCCDSITDFWRRWHISLGSFFRDYLYIPMGGNRRHQPFNIMVVWMLTGFWHGASWNFLIWGLFYGLIILTEKHTLLRVAHRIPKPLLHLYSLLLVVVGWGIFYFEDFGQMTHFFQAFFGGASFSDFAVTDALRSYGWLWVAAVLCCLPLREWLNRRTASWTEAHPGLRLAARSILAFLLLAVSVALLVGATNNAFLYTRF
ncbi:MAG: MBOAT family protein [Bacteroidales bacterium]|nr:MBOAT family protein [Bacteroidales bacterium]